MIFGTEKFFMKSILDFKFFVKTTFDIQISFVTVPNVLS